MNPEGVRVEEMERLFEVMQVDVMKYEEKGFVVILCWGINARIGSGVEDHPNSNRKRLWDLVRSGDFVVGNKLCCEGRWT